MLDLVMLLGGGILLYFGAEWLVGGAAGLANALGIRPVLVGLTVVAYGTSAPEAVVGFQAAYGGHGALALGNVIGSNIANLGLILGATALVSPPPHRSGLCAPGYSCTAGVNTGGSAASPGREARHA